MSICILNQHQNAMASGFFYMPSTKSCRAIGRASLGCYANQRPVKGLLFEETRCGSNFNLISLITEYDPPGKVNKWIVGGYKSPHYIHIYRGLFHVRKGWNHFGMWIHWCCCCTSTSELYITNMYTTAKIPYLYTYICICRYNWFFTLSP